MKPNTLQDFLNKKVRVYVTDETEIYGKLTVIDKGGIILISDDSSYYIPKQSIIYIEE